MTQDSTPAKSLHLQIAAAASRLSRWRVHPRSLEKAVVWEQIESFGFEVRLGHPEIATDVALGVPVPGEWIDCLMALAYEYDTPEQASKVRSRCFLALARGLEVSEASTLLKDRFPAGPHLEMLANSGVLPKGVLLEHFGFSLEQPMKGLRICLEGSSWPKMQELFLARGVDLSGPAPSLGELTRYGSLRFLNLDTAEGRLAPYLGVECHLAPGSTDLQRLLARLLDLGLCDTEDSAALLAWDGSHRVNNDTIMAYRVTHLKFQYGTPAPVKAYLACLPIDRRHESPLGSLRVASIVGQGISSVQNLKPIPSWDCSQYGLLGGLLEHEGEALRGTLSYRELRLRAGAVAKKLKADGLLEGELVAVSLPRGWRQCVAVCGILMAGGAYLPLNSHWPAARRNEILERAQCQRVIAEGDFLQESEFSVSLIPGNRLAYVIYTSGSTGEPKGVAVSHAAALNTIRDINQRFEVGAGDTILGLSSLTFDLSVYDLFGAWDAGATLIPLEEEDLLGGSPSPAVLQRLAAQATVWNSVPALMQLFLKGLQNQPFPATLRLVLMSGDWIPTELPRELWSRSPKLEVISLGGATEAAIWSILHPISDSNSRAASIPYGAPESMQGQRVLVLREDLQPCRTEEEGELFIAGRGLAIGYLNSPELTQSAFLEHPSLGRIYRTGDLGRLCSDGLVALHGRKDLQVKLMGHRIELVEVESKLLRQYGVQEAVATVCRDAPSGPCLVAWIVGQACEKQLRPKLQSLLPKAYLPRFILNIPSLPLNTHQKVDRSRLSVWSEIQQHCSTSAIVKSDQLLSGILETVAEVWSEALGQNVSRSSNFFAMGGASFAVLEATLALEKKLGLSLAPGLIYDYPTPEAYAVGLNVLQAIHPKLAVGNLHPDDMESRIQLEKRFTNDWALSRDQLEAQFSHYPQGQWVVKAGARVVGALCGFRLDTKKLQETHTWHSITAEGTFSTHQPNGDCFYVADLRVDPEYRDAAALPLLWQVFCAFLRENGDIAEVRGSAPLFGAASWEEEPILGMYLRLGAVALGRQEDYDLHGPQPTPFVAVSFPRELLSS